MAKLDTSKLNENDYVFINIPTYGIEGEGGNEIVKNILCRFKRWTARYQGASNINGVEVEPEISTVIECGFKSVGKFSDMHYPNHVLSFRLATFCAVDGKPCVDVQHICRRDSSKPKTKQCNKDACPNCVLPKELERRGVAMDLDSEVIERIMKRQYCIDY